MRCHTGNHELNLLRNDAKDGSGWYFDSQDAHDQKSSPLINAQTNKRTTKRFATFSSIAHRSPSVTIFDQHAAWDSDAIARSEGHKKAKPLPELYQNGIAPHRQITESNLWSSKKTSMASTISSINIIHHQCCMHPPKGNHQPKPTTHYEY